MSASEDIFMAKYELRKYDKKKNQTKTKQNTAVKRCFIFQYDKPYQSP